MGKLERTIQPSVPEASKSHLSDNMIPGCFPGEVTDIRDPERIGRVRVRADLIAPGKDLPHGTDGWIPFLERTTNNAVPGGSHTLVEVGAQVIVAPLMGGSTQYVILGCVPNRVDPPHPELSRAAGTYGYHTAGAVTEVNNDNDSSQIQIYPNGVTKSISPTGDITMQTQEEGRLQIQQDGAIRSENPNAFDSISADGTIVNRSAEGATSTLDKEGSIDLQTPWASNLNLAEIQSKMEGPLSAIGASFLKAGEQFSGILGTAKEVMGQVQKVTGKLQSGLGGLGDLGGLGGIGGGLFEQVDGLSSGLDQLDGLMSGLQDGIQNQLPAALESLEEIATMPTGDLAGVFSGEIQAFTKGNLDGILPRLEQVVGANLPGSDIIGRIKEIVPVELLGKFNKQTEQLTGTLDGLNFLPDEAKFTQQINAVVDSLLQDGVSSVSSLLETGIASGFGKLESAITEHISAIETRKTFPDLPNSGESEELKIVEAIPAKTRRLFEQELLRKIATRIAKKIVKQDALEAGEVKNALIDALSDGQEDLLDLEEVAVEISTGLQALLRRRRREQIRKTKGLRASLAVAVDEETVVPQRQGTAWKLLGSTLLAPVIEAAIPNVFAEILTPEEYQAVKTALEQILGDDQKSAYGNPSLPDLIQILQLGVQRIADAQKELSPFDKLTRSQKVEAIEAVAQSVYQLVTATQQLTVQPAEIAGSGIQADQAKNINQEPVLLGSFLHLTDSDVGDIVQPAAAASFGVATTEAELQSIIDSVSSQVFAGLDSAAVQSIPDLALRGVPPDLVQRLGRPSIRAFLEAVRDQVLERAVYSPAEDEVNAGAEEIGEVTAAESVSRLQQQPAGRKAKTLEQREKRSLYKTVYGALDVRAKLELGDKNSRRLCARLALDLTQNAFGLDEKISKPEARAVVAPWVERVFASRLAEQRRSEIAKKIVNAVCSRDPIITSGAQTQEVMLIVKRHLPRSLVEERTRKQLQQIVKTAARKNSVQAVIATIHGEAVKSAARSAYDTVEAESAKVESVSGIRQLVSGVRFRSPGLIKQAASIIGDSEDTGLQALALELLRSSTGLGENPVTDKPVLVQARKFYDSAGELFSFTGLGLSGLNNTDTTAIERSSTQSGSTQSSQGTAIQEAGDGVGLDQATAPQSGALDLGYEDLDFGSLDEVDSLLDPASGGFSGATSSLGGDTLMPIPTAATGLPADADYGGSIEQWMQTAGMDLMEQGIGALQEQFQGLLSEGLAQITAMSNLAPIGGGASVVADMITTEAFSFLKQAGPSLQVLPVQAALTGSFGASRVYADNYSVGLASAFGGMSFGQFGGALSGLGPMIFSALGGSSGFSMTGAGASLHSLDPSATQPKLPGTQEEVDELLESGDPPPVEPQGIIAQVAARGNQAFMRSGGHEIVVDGNGVFIDGFNLEYLLSLESRFSALESRLASLETPPIPPITP